MREECEAQFMDVTVILYGHLQWYAPDKQKTHQLSVEEGTAVGAIVDRLQLPRPEIATMMVNGSPVEDGHSLMDQDEVTIVPVISGG